MANRLQASTSPYLRQHADNPVDWHEWSAEAFEEARRRDVPVLLSVGYATCHWCHVMAHESFEDAETAAFMNEHFVNVKVDREERPDIDRIYMDAVTAISGRGGWPMTVFLTPLGKPIYAGTYYPKDRRGNHPSFVDVMTAIVDAWHGDRAGALAQADHITEAINRGFPPTQVLPTIDDLEGSMRTIEASFDSVHHGFGTAPKFPQAPTLEFLLRMIALRPGTDAAVSAETMLSSMLEAMASGGMYDHLLGGFARYSVDAAWTIPHFEKMLYDNAQLARVYLRAWQLFANERFRTVAIEVLDYLDTVMADPAGALHSAEDADSEGAEGRFAVWTWEELGRVLGDDRSLAAAIYGATPEGNFEGANNLVRRSDLTDVAASLDLSLDDVESARRRIDETLRAVRAGRTPPGRDHKIVSAWNGLAIRAFAEAGAILGTDRYLARAEAIAAFIGDEASPEGHLARSWRDRPGHPAFAEDHAAMAVGLYALYAASGTERWFRAAEAHVERLRADFRDPEGGFASTRSDAEGLIARPKNLQDNPTPSDNSLGLEALLLHASYTGDLSAIDEAEATMGAIAPIAIRHPTFGGYALAVWLTHLSGIDEVAIVGDDTSALEHVVWSAFRPNVALATGDGTPSVVPLLENRPASTPAQAFVCRGFVCERPVTAPTELATQIDRPPV
jgi:uncharacterized protein YyaL (SSP411 family)